MGGVAANEASVYRTIRMLESDGLVVPIRYPDGTVRYFTVRESARLQTFPDDYVFHGSWTETMRQLGNAVPVRLARTVAKSVASQLSEIA